MRSILKALLFAALAVLWFMAVALAGLMVLSWWLANHYVGP